jgi:hypothetical protein
MENHMAIRAVQDQNDARGTARLLARTAKRTLEHPTDSAGGRVALAGLFRLIKAYRSHELMGFEYQPRHEQALEGMTIVWQGESHVADLRTALNSALVETYQGTTEDAALESVERVLRSAAKKQPAEASELQQTTQFLGVLVQKLEASA